MTGKKPLTYAKAGVDINKADQAKKQLAGQLDYVRDLGKALYKLGLPETSTREHFAGLIEFGDHFLALCADGVGTKLLIANELEKWDTVGIDCVAMNVNDCICLGAEPLAMVDYLALPKPDDRLCQEIGKGLNEGARQSNISLVGGETAILPELVKTFDIAGTCLGTVHKDHVIDSNKITDGDVLIGLPSSGVHSNGLTLARKIVKQSGLSMHDMLPGGACTVGEELLKPTRIYVQPVLNLVKELGPMGDDVFHGLVNVTGSGMQKWERIQKDLEMMVDCKALDIPPVFRFLRTAGNVDKAEMYKTFNMGIGFIVVIKKGHEDRAIELLKQDGAPSPKVIGRVVKKGTAQQELSRTEGINGNGRSENVRLSGNIFLHGLETLE